MSEVVLSSGPDGTEGGAVHEVTSADRLLARVRFTPHRPASGQYRGEAGAAFKVDLARVHLLRELSAEQVAVIDRLVADMAQDVARSLAVAVAEVTGAALVISRAGNTGGQVNG